MRAATHSLAAAEAKLDEATISPFFQFTARGATGLAPDAHGVPGFTPDSQVPTDQSWGPFLSGSVQGALPLYTFGKLSAARDAARAGIRGADLGAKRVRAQLRFDSRRAYFALQLALDTLQMISEGRGKLEKAIRRLQEQVESGDPNIDDFDMYRLEAALAEVDARAAEAHQFETAAIAALRVLTGKPRISIPECPIARVAFEPQGVDAYMDQAHQDRPEIGLLQAAMDARRADLRAQRAGYFPDLALALQASRTVTPGRTDQNDPFIMDAANITLLGAALVLEWDLDLWGNSARVRAAENRLSVAEAQSAQARDGVDLEIAMAHASVLEARAREQAWSRGHQNTRRWFVAAAQGYEVGAREPKDLIDALKAYFTARFSHLQSIHDHNVAVARLEQAVGTNVVTPESWNQSCEIIEENSMPTQTDSP